MITSILTITRHRVIVKGEVDDMIDYYTVSEFSKITGKDSGNIRKLLINGTIVGEKVGHQWIIPKDTKYPEDKRLKSGEFKNWRQRNDVSRRNPKLMKSLYIISKKLCDIYDNKVEKIVLYGSYARCEETSDSDVDIAIILKEGHTEQMHDKMIDLIVDYELDLGVTLSVVPIEYDNYVEWENTLPFYRNIEKEGIVLWKTA